MHCTLHRQSAFSRSWMACYCRGKELASQSLSDAAESEHEEEISSAMKE